MTLREEIINKVEDFFNSEYRITEGIVIPDVEDIQLENVGKELELAMMFIDIKESTRIVDSFRRKTAAKMYQSFLWGIAKIARFNNGEIRSFNGDGVLIAFIGNDKCSNATRAALQMSWFCQEILKPKIEYHFRFNQQLNKLSFKIGIGIDVGNILVVRGGIRGENNNDLVWVGNPTNFAVKLSEYTKNFYHQIAISQNVFNNIDNYLKFGSFLKLPIWQQRLIGLFEIIYVSNAIIPIL